MQKAIEGFVRLGYIAKAAVYLLIGTLALRVAIGVRGGRFADQSAALAVVLRQPLGSLLLLLIAIGLLAYAVWQITAAVLGRRHHARSSALARVPAILRAALYGAIGVQALKLAAGLRAAHTGPQPLIRAALHWPFGQWLVFAAGIASAWYGVVEIGHAIDGRLEPDLDAPTLRRCAGTWALDIARAGIVARALVMVVLALGVVRAALAHRAALAGGMDASLLVLDSLPSGSVVLAATAAGLLAYGVYQLLHARYAQL